MRLISAKQCSIHVSRARYMVEKNSKIYTFISTSLFRGCPLVRTPDEWATTKQTCRDKRVVFLNFSLPYKRYMHMALGDALLIITDVCMDFEPCFKVYSLVK